MGTSLVVQPFASLVDKYGKIILRDLRISSFFDRVNKNVPRILINLEKAGSVCFKCSLFIANVLSLRLNYSETYYFGRGLDLEECFLDRDLILIVIEMFFGKARATMVQNNLLSCLVGK